MSYKPFVAYFIEQWNVYNISWTRPALVYQRSASLDATIEIEIGIGIEMILPIQFCRRMSNGLKQVTLECMESRE